MVLVSFLFFLSIYLFLYPPEQKQKFRFVPEDPPIFKVGSELFKPMKSKQK